MRTPVRLLVTLALAALLTSLLAAPPTSAAPAVVNVTLKLDFDSSMFPGPTPEDPTIVIVAGGRVIEKSGGVYPVPLRPGDRGRASFVVRALDAEGRLGPWLIRPQAGVNHHFFDWSGTRGFWEATAQDSTVGPLKVVYDGVPPLPEEPIGGFDLFDHTGSGLSQTVTLYATLFRGPAGTRTTVQFFGCDGARPVVTLTSFATTEDDVVQLAFPADALQIGKRGRYRVSVQRPGEPDYVVTRTLRTKAACDPQALRMEDATAGALAFGVDEIDSENAFPLWRLGEESASEVRRHVGTEGPDPRVDEPIVAAPIDYQRTRLRSIDDVLRWRVGNQWKKTRFAWQIRPKPEWVGKRLTLQVTVRDGSIGDYRWDGAVTHVVDYGKIRPRR